MKKATKPKQTASEKRIFAQMYEVRNSILAVDTRVDRLVERLKWLHDQVQKMDIVQHELIEKYDQPLVDDGPMGLPHVSPASMPPTQETYLKVWRVMHDPEHKDKTAKQIWGLLNNDSKPDPKNYVLTDADWQRVIDEKFLCEFGGSRNKEILAYLRAVEPSVDPELDGDGLQFHARSYLGYFTVCKPLNKPGVMQPYFGQGMPVSASTRVLIKQRNGLCSIGKALEQDWNIMGCSSDIVAFMVLE